MALKIVWSKRAYQKFDQITSYIQAKWGEKPTREFISKVFDFLEILSEYPELGSLENKENNIRGFTIVRQVTIFYRISGDRIVIVLFFDNKQSPTRKRF